MGVEIRRVNEGSSKLLEEAQKLVTDIFYKAPKAHLAPLMSPSSHTHKIL